MYYVDFILRNDTKNYSDTQLCNWKDKINEAIEEFNQKDSRITDRAKIELVKVGEKEFKILVTIDERFSPEERSFYTRIGALSRILKEKGMTEILSNHGKLFTLNVTKASDKVEDFNENENNIEYRKIYINCKDKDIMIPKELIEKGYSIKFY